MSSSASHIETEWLNRIAQGDGQVFALLVKRYKDNIYTTALHLTRSTSLAEDIVQDVFLKIWLKRSTLSTIENFGAYLHAVAQNTIFTNLKRIAREMEKQKEMGRRVEMVLATDTAHTILEKEYGALLRRAIERLSPRQQQIYE